MIWEKKTIISSNTGHFNNSGRNPNSLKIFFSRSVLRMYLRGSTIKSEVKNELFLSRAIGSQHILGVLHWVHQDTHLQRMKKLNNGYRQTIQIFFTTSIFISQKPFNKMDIFMSQKIKKITDIYTNNNRIHHTCCYLHTKTGLIITFWPCFYIW